jgi:hypothetical protein
MIAAVKAIPTGAQRRPTPVLVRGEVTGHAHRVADPTSAEVWERHGQMFIAVVAASATIVHEEHKPITLPQGYYRVWQQREYTPAAIVRVAD